MNAFGIFERYWFVPAPAARLATLRILIGTFVLLYLAFGFVVTTYVIFVLGLNLPLVMWNWPLP